jgi:hypothetical protein
MKATTRSIPFKEEKVEDKCIYCGRPAKFLPIWAVPIKKAGLPIKANQLLLNFI